MATVAFSVDGLPPKKTRNLSVWEEKQHDEITALREKAVEAFLEPEVPRTFTGNVHLTLRLYIENEKARRVWNEPGDLDNFVSGVCDGLGAACPQTQEEFCDSMEELEHRGVLPYEPIAFLDDKQVVEIVASRHEGDHDWYLVEVAGE